MARFAIVVCVVVWALVGVGVDSTHYTRARDNEVVQEGPPGVLVEALRQVLGVPEGQAGHGAQMHGSHHGRGQRPPRYMLNLYRRLNSGRSTLPRRANTVRSYLPQTGVADLEADVLVYNVSGTAEEHVLGAWLHVRGGGAKSRPSPRTRPTRLLLYLLQPPNYLPNTPIVTVNVSPGKQEVEVTRAVREAVGSREGGRGEGVVLGVRIEQMRQGRYVGRTLNKFRNNPPLLMVYSSDPALLDLAALGASALNLTHINHAHHIHHHHQVPAHSRTHNLKRYTRDVDDLKTPGVSRSRRYIGGTWPSADQQNLSYFEDPTHAHSRALLTNELPLSNPSLPEAEQQQLTRNTEKRPARRHRRRRKQRGGGGNDNLIPYPKNYSKTKWGARDRRKKNKRKRKNNNRFIPDEWLNIAQNTISNEANDAVGSPNSLAGGGGGRPCQRHRLRVDFREMGWDYFIVAPTGFDAYYCAGVCPFPLTKPNWRSRKLCELSGSNHAIIQSLMALISERSDVPSPCCVPDELEPVSVLFCDDEGHFYLKNYSKMIVNSCSCQ